MRPWLLVKLVASQGQVIAHRTPRSAVAFYGGTFQVEKFIERQIGMWRSMAQTLRTHFQKCPKCPHEQEVNQAVGKILNLHTLLNRYCTTACTKR